MLLHFIFVIKEEDLEHRKEEFEYVKSMAKFFQKWIKENFSNFTSTTMNRSLLSFGFG